ncbi:MAG: DUF1653 domain-containing protein [Verrucomicrobiota bacterium]
MPATGEGWRHYKGGLYTVIGMARDDEGEAIVVYTDYMWGLAQLAPIYTQKLGRFVQEVENDKPRMRYEREAADHPFCQYISEAVRL